MKILFTFIFLLSFGTLSAQTGWQFESSNTSLNLNVVSFPDSDVGFVVGDSGIILCHGPGWSVKPFVAINDYYGAYFIDRFEGVVVGKYGIFIRTTDQGSTWYPCLKEPAPDLNAVSFSSKENGIVVGGSGWILVTSDRGKSWVTEVSGTTQTFNGISTLSTEMSITVGEIGLIKYKHFSGGWIIGNSGTNKNLNDVCMIDSLNAITIGDSGVILRTYSGGFNWTPQVSFTSKTLRAMSFAKKATGMVVGDSGTILFTSDTGNTWTHQSSGTVNSLRDIVMIDENNAYAVGSGGTILHTTDGGKLWTRQNLPHPLTTSVTPEPFGRRTSISYELLKASKVRIRIYDALGRELEALDSDGMLESGTHHIEFDGSRYPEGTFHYQIETDGFYGVGKMTKVVY